MCYEGDYYGELMVCWLDCFIWYGKDFNCLVLDYVCLFVVFWVYCRVGLWDCFCLVFVWFGVGVWGCWWSVGIFVWVF